MHRLKISAFIIFGLLGANAQNDIDAIRYSRSGIGGSARFISMGGAFGAVGADLGCAAYNPAGLGVFRKGEISFTGSLRFTNNTAKIYNSSTAAPDVNFAFNDFGLAYAWVPQSDPDSRNVIAFNNSQLQNFSGSTSMSGYTNKSSILNDMTTLADRNGNVDNLNYSYEGLAYDTYLLDYDGSKFISLVDPKRTVLQTRDIVTSGRMNELNFSYAYAYRDKFYFGASLGLPRIRYTSTTTHYEADDKDSMRIKFTSLYDYTTTYVDGISSLDTTYRTKLGFNSLTYTEYFKTQGTGVNLKLGGIMRINDFLRVGLYYHTPTVYYLNDTYYNSMSASFDAKPNSPIESKNPAGEGGYFEYRVITPSKLSFNSAVIIKKNAVIALDYEFVNYRSARLASDKASDFKDANMLIQNKYTAGHNIRLGGEVNIKPVMLRAGYAMLGSPFGNVFSGTLVRHNVSLGIGFRTKGQWYFDFFWVKSLSNEDYYLFTTTNTRARLNFNATTLGATVGVKF